MCVSHTKVTLNMVFVTKHMKQTNNLSKQNPFSMGEIQSMTENKIEEDG